MNGTGIEVSNSAEAVPSALDIPTEPKAFERWLEARWDGLPPELKTLGVRVALSFPTSTQRAWDESYALRKAAKADWSAFTTAYREHVREAV